MEFTDAEYIPSAGGAGRTPEVNPYTDVITSIALKTDAKGKPVAKGLPLTYKDDAERKALIAKAKRQMGEVGHKLTPPVSVIAPPAAIKQTGKNSLTLVFWTVPLISKPRKAETVETVPDVAK